MRKLLVVTAALCAVSAAAFAQKPVIEKNGVQDAASNTPNIAQGGIFVVKGTNLCSPGYTTGAAPLPTTLSGVKITFTPAAGGAGIDAYMVYTYNQSGVTQLAGILPSTVAPGNYNVTVNLNGTSSDASAATVVQRKYSIITVSGSGAGRAVAQNAVSGTQLDLNRFTTGTISGFTYSPAKPGQTLILWGTGLGPITKADNDVPGAIDLNSQVAIRVNVGSSVITPTYAGRAPQFPGTDQINFMLPADVQTGCLVPLQVSVGGQLSNVTTLSIATSSAAACGHPTFNQATLSKLDQGGTLTTGSFTLSSFATSFSYPPFIPNSDAKLETMGGSFARYTADQLGDATGVLNTIDSCVVYHRVGSQSALLGGTSGTLLDAGSSLALTGPNGLNKTVARSADKSYATETVTAISGLPALPGGISIPGIGSLGGTAFIVAGSYQLKGSGGADVGGFTANLTVGSPLTAGPIADTIPRNAPLTVTWTGGGASDLVIIGGTSGSNAPTSTTDNPQYDAVVFSCTTTGDKKSFTVPVSVLSQLPVTPAGGILAGKGIGILTVLSATQPTAANGTFTAPLTGGGSIDFGAFLSTVGSLKQVIYQ